MKRWICLLFIKIFRLTVFTLEDATARGWSNKAIWVWYRRGVKVGWSEQMFTRGYVESAVTKVKAKAHLLAVKSVDSQDNSVLAYPSNGEVAGSATARILKYVLNAAGYSHCEPFIEEKKMKFLLLLSMLASLASCNIPELIIDRGIRIDKDDFVPSRKDFGLYVLPSGLAEYDAVTGSLILYPNLDMELLHAGILGVTPEIIHVGGDFLSPSTYYHARGMSSIACFSHQYNVTKTKRISQSVEIEAHLCNDGLIVFYSGWTEIAVWILRILGKD